MGNKAKNEKGKIVLTREEYDKLKSRAEQYDEIVDNISNRILKQNLGAYKVLGKENWDKND